MTMTSPSTAAAGLHPLRRSRSAALPPTRSSADQQLGQEPGGRHSAARPPGPGRLSIAQVRTDPLGFVTDLHRRYGDVSSHQVDADTVIVVHRPDLARQLLTGNGANYTKLDTPDDHMLRPLLGNGLLTSTGAEWSKQRQTAAPAFRPHRVRQFDVVMTQAAAALADRLALAPPETEVAVDHQFTSLTLRIVVEAILSMRLDGVGDGFGRAVDAVNSYIGHDAATDPGGAGPSRLSFEQAKGFLELVTTTLIAARRTTAEQTPQPDSAGGDLLTAMMAGESTLTERELLDQVLTLIMAGHETTAKSLTWSVFLLDRHPDWRMRLENEVDRVLGTAAGPRLPTAADLARLPLCGRVIREALRLYPPIWLTSRRAIGPDRLDGYRVEAGDLVCVSQWVLHRDPRYWPHPERFDPDRFADPAQLTPHAYLPFGGGERICIGQHFALLEATLVLATLVSRLRLRLRAGTEVEPEALVTLRPRGGMPMTVQRR